MCPLLFIVKIVVVDQNCQGGGAILDYLFDQRCGSLVSRDGRLQSTWGVRNGQDRMRDSFLCLLHSQWNSSRSANS